VGVNVNVEDHALAEILKDQNALFHVCENKEKQNKIRVILKSRRRNTIKRDIFLNLN